MTRRLFGRALVAILGLSLGACISDDPGQGPPVRSLQFPDEWSGGGASYQIGLDKDGRNGGVAGFLAARTNVPSGFGVLSQFIRADDFRGKRVRWSGWVRHTFVDSGGLWMRIDAPNSTIPFDNMLSRAITGNADWHQVSVVLDVPTNAIGIAMGALLTGDGDMVLDDFALDVVGADVATTGISVVPVLDSASMDGLYARRRRVALNLGFEGMQTPDAASVTWLRTNSSELTSAEPVTSTADLAAFGTMVGDAHIVGLGEGTHGTREFFTMKHRLIQYLVQEKGFTHFAIEATWPEANEINRYVLTGMGNPAPLIRNMHFWTWDVQEVLDLVTWMRAWNTTAPPSQQVRFFGFDMQYPGVALDSVTAFVARVSPGSSVFVSQRLNCIMPFRNNGGIFQRDRSQYTALSASAKTACRDSLQQAFDFLSANRSAFEQASSEDAFANALQSARIILQFEAMAAPSGGQGSASRDRSMADNVDWLLSRAAPGTRMVLWAHNYHVSRGPNAMGRHLAARHGTDYVTLGFLFGTGRFTVVDAIGTIAPQEATLIPSFSMESAFQAVGRERSLFDARRLTQAGAPIWLRDPRMRSIGATFNPSAEASYYSINFLPDDYDLLIHIATTRASRRLP